MKTVAKLLSLLVLGSLLMQSAMACGPFTVDPLFAFSKHPGYPIKDYAKGKIGIVPDSYGRMSLFVFYRELNNLPLSAKEQEQFEDALKNRIGIRPTDDENTPEPSVPKNDAVEQWKSSRAKVFAGDAKLEREKRIPDNYFTWTSCLDDAFRNASNTLETRITKYGLNNDVKEWVNGQDAVFANCGDGGNKNPANLAENAPEWLRQDRAYQKAAALFYDGKDAAARTEFQKIANDKNSPWRNTARFVVARTYIREASFIDDTEDDVASIGETTSNVANAVKNAANYAARAAKSESSNLQPKTAQQKKDERAELHRKAEMLLKEFLADSSMKDFHASAQRLLNLVGYRAAPREQRDKLAQVLVQKGENLNFYNDLVDYIWLLDKVDSEASERGMEREAKEAEKAGKEPAYDYNLKLQDIPNSELGADLTDWLFTYQAEDGFPHAFEKWRKTKSLAWFVAALVKAKKDSPNFAELLNEADKIKSDSRAYATVRHEQIRLLIASGKRAEAKQKLNEIVQHLGKFTRSTQNDFTSQRLQLADNLDEFLKFSQRQAATFVWSDDGNEQGDDLRGQKSLIGWKDRQMFDYDSVAVFNEKMPLSVLRQAALNPNLPNHLKKFLVIAVWTRAFVLGNTAVQTEFTPLMAKFAPEYKVAPTTSEANSLLTLGRNPAINIYIPVGYGREDSTTTAVDSIRGNWWCVENRSEADFPAFLTEAEKTAARNEQAKIKASGESATFLTRRALEFANKNMTNPNTPEILHWVVRSTRYGCRDKDTLRFSKAAFSILHKSFPRNQWTKKTPYFFGENEN